MREIKSSEAKTRFSELLDDVERGETIVITRHGKAIARLGPEADQHRAERAKIVERIRANRATMPKLTLEEIISARREGHKY